MNQHQAQTIRDLLIALEDYDLDTLIEQVNNEKLRRAYNYAIVAIEGEERAKERYENEAFMFGMKGGMDR
jgi:hypothetical protein